MEESIPLFATTQIAVPRRLLRARQVKAGRVRRLSLVVIGARVA